jgi:hypothetical protein
MTVLAHMKQLGCYVDASTMLSAIKGGQLAVCQYLIAEQCPRNASICTMAANNGHMEIVRLLHENGTPWHSAKIRQAAVEHGSVEMLQYLKKQGGVFNKRAMSTAAGRGHTHVCQYMRAEQCPWDATACTEAAAGCHVDTLRWLHEQGCPWDVEAARRTALHSNQPAVFEYALSVEPAVSSAQLTEMLNFTGKRDMLEIAKLLRQHGAEWSAAMLGWGDDAEQWAKEEGYASSLSDY